MNKRGKGRVQEHVQINENRRKDSCSSEARSSVPKIWKWTTHEAPSASQLQSLFPSPTSQSYVEDTNERNPNIDFVQLGEAHVQVQGQADHHE